MWDACDFGSYAAQVRLDRIRSSRVLRSFVHSGVRGARPFFFLCVYLLLPFPSRSIVSVTFLDLGFAGTGAS